MSDQMLNYREIYAEVYAQYDSILKGDPAKYEELMCNYINSIIESEKRYNVLEQTVHKLENLVSIVENSNTTATNTVATIVAEGLDNLLTIPESFTISDNSLNNLKDLASITQTSNNTATPTLKTISVPNEADIINFVHETYIEPTFSVEEN